jgi:DNA repair photolyase
MNGLGKFKVVNHCKLYNYCSIRKTFQPYYRCSHFCIYCFSSFGYKWNSLFNHTSSIISVDVDKAVEDYHSLKPYTQIEISSNCDPFDLVYEKEHQITLEFLSKIKKIERDDIYITFITKSNLISQKEYLEVLPNNKNCIIQINVEGYGDQLKILSPKASTYNQRLKTVQILCENEFRVSIRIDPIIPFFISIKDIEKIIEDFELNGIKHVTASAIKLQEIQIKNIEELIGKEIRNSLVKNEKVYYFKRDVRLTYFNKIKNVCEEKGLTYAFCKDNLIEDKKGVYCDPFHLITNRSFIKKRKNLSITDFF